MVNKSVHSIFVTNEEQTPLQDAPVELSFKIETNEASLIRQDTYEGRPHTVLPVVLIKEGVWNGLYYPADELAKFPAAWNNRPIPVYHPEDIDGNRISANDPRVLEKWNAGHVFNASWDDSTKKLKGEMWIDNEKAQKLDAGKRMLQMVDEGMMIEVSTGLFIDNDAQKGVFDGKEYSGIARNHRPDHLAALPDRKGACSVEDGAGAPRTNQQDDSEARPSWIRRILTKMGFISNDDSLDDRRAALRTALEKRFTSSYVYLVDMRTESVVFEYETKSGQMKGLYLLGYKLGEDGSVELSTDTPTEVKVRTEYVPVTNTGEPQMDRAAMIETLQKKGWGADEDKAILETMSDEQLKRLLPAEEETPPPATPPAAPATHSAPETPPATTAPPAAAPPAVTMESYVANAPAEIQDVLKSAVEANRRKHAFMVNQLKGVPNCPFTEQQLQGMTVEQLTPLLALAGKPSFAGNEIDTPASPPPTPTTNSMPSWDWKEDKLSK